MKGNLIMKATNNNSLMVNKNETIECVNEASYLFGAYVCSELDKIGMRYSYRHVLKPLVDNESLNQLELVKLTNLKAPTISITLRNMEHDGIVRREKNDDDRRETHVYITEKGKKMYAKVLAALDKAEETMLRGVSEKELKILRDTLSKLSGNIRMEMENEK